MAVLPIVKIGHPVLRKVAEEITDFNGDLKLLAADMIEGHTPLIFSGKRPNLEFLFNLTRSSDKCYPGWLPFGINDVYLKKNISLEKCWLHIRLKKNMDEIVLFDTDLISDDLEIVAQYRGCSLKRFRSGLTAKKKTVQDKTDNRRISDIPRTENVSDLQDRIQKYLITELHKVINSWITDLDANLMDLGLESAKIMALTDKIEKDLEIELNPTLLFEYTNIKELSEFFAEEYRDSFIKLFEIVQEYSENDKHSLEFSPSTIVQKENIQTVDVDLNTVTEVETTKSVKTGRDDIAVVGMSGKFADAVDVEAFWNNLCEKKDLMKEIPEDHWDYRPWFDSDRTVKDKTYCKWGSFIDDVDKFDAEFFKISRKEAEWMDPQIRLMLQCIYATYEDSGYINQMRGSDTGVFVGVCFKDYADKIAEMNLPVSPYAGTGNSQTVVANQASFSFDFTGPSIAIDTACSSSLFALHYACQALRNKECGMAFVGGVNLLLSSYHYRYFSSIGALSPTGRCNSFDTAADGYVPGECVAGILLKPLSEAKKDNDTIHAIIKGSAALHGGYTPSLTAPSVKGEENVILKAWDNAGIDPETISYIEAHGTGTKLGDPVEISALNKAFKRFTQKENFCAIGSAKANIGHPESAAGIAGIIKVILQMKHKKIPCMPKFQTLNPYIQLDKSPLFINQEIKEWKTKENVPLRAGISSFGFSGAYAHVVIEGFDTNLVKMQNYKETKLNGSQIFVLSAKDEERLKTYTKRIVEFLEKNNNRLNLAEIAYTSQIGREAMEERMAVTVRSVEELQEKLTGFLKGKGNIVDLYRGQAIRNRETLSVFTADDDISKLVDVWVAKGKYEKFLDLWVNGMAFDWNKLYGDMKPCKIDLPTYPFAKERYWIPEFGLEKNKLES